MEELVASTRGNHVTLEHQNSSSLCASPLLKHVQMVFSYYQWLLQSNQTRLLLIHIQLLVSTSSRLFKGW